MSALKVLDNETNFEFTFYILIFMECFKTNLILLYLTSFKPEKNTILSTISEKKLKPIINILNIFEKSPEKILDKIENNDDKFEYGVKLFTIILYFNYNFNKERMNEFISNENNKDYKYQGIIKYSNLFTKLNLEKEQIIKLIKFSKDFNQLCNILSYCKNLYEILEIINENFEIFCKLYKEAEINKNTLKIDLEKLISPNKNDDLKAISELYITLIEAQKKNEIKNSFILFNKSLFINYINYYNSIDVDKLFYIKDMIKISKIDIEINKYIHETGLLLSEIGKLKNINLLHFIKKDDYYNLKNYKNISFRSLDILKGLDINTFNENFYLEWKKMNWYDIF